MKTTETAECDDDSTTTAPSPPSFSPFLYTALIIEPRSHPGLEYVVGNMLDNLDEHTWQVIVFHGAENRSFLDRCKDDNPTWNRAHRSDRLSFVELPGQIRNLSIKEYEQTLFQRWIYDQIPTELFLIFQVDSGICSSRKHLIQKWVEEPFDYMGAPWRHENHPVHGRVGNGGFSLRRKSKMLRILDMCPIERSPYSPNFAEDLFFAWGCEAVQDSMNLPDLQTARQFSTESIYSDSFGFHKPWGLHPFHWNQFVNECPEAQIVFEHFRSKPSP